MAKEPKMKIGIGADTGDFEKGARKVKQEMKDLDKVSSDAFAAIGNAIGIDTGKIQQFSSALSGLGNKLTQTGAEGSSAFSKIGSAITSVGAGIAGLGLAAAIASFKLLNAEAEAFKNTVQGANIELQTKAYIDTYRQVFHDFNAGTGQSVAEFESELKKRWARLSSNISQNFVRTLTGNVNWATALAGPVVGSLFGNKEQIQAATSAAEQAEIITGQIYELERQRKEQSIELARINAEIADQMSVARDASYAIAERQQAINAVQGLIAQKEQMTVSLEQQLAQLYKQRSDLASDDIAAADATLAQEQRAYEAQRSITTELNSLIKLKNQIATASAEAAAAAAAEAAATQKIVESRRALAEWGEMAGSVSGITASVEVPVSFIIPPKAKEQFEQDLLDLTSQLTDFSVSLSGAIGTLTADLLTGENAWSNFTNNALSAFGDMAIAIGKIAIEAGIASEGIKVALTLGGGYVAMAAGAALVMLGTAVKSGLSNIANGNYSATASVASSGASNYATNDLATKEVNVNVTGTLVASGSNLVAVLNNENNRRRNTT